MRAFDVRTGAPAWRAWDFTGAELTLQDAANTAVRRLVVDRSGRLYAGGDTEGFEELSPAKAGGLTLAPPSELDLSTLLRCV